MIFFAKEFAIVRSRFILVVGVLKLNGSRCGFGNFYAPNDDADREVFFDEVKQIIAGYDVPWVLGGDFNIVRNSEEKIGSVHNQSAMQCFVDFAEDLGLIDLPLTGDRFTWGNYRDQPSFSRLDRFLIAPDFILLFPGLSQ